MKIEINIKPSRSKKDLGKVSIHEFNKEGESRLITSGNSPQHHVFINNVIKTINDDSKKGLWSVVNIGNKIFAVSI